MLLSHFFAKNNKTKITEVVRSRHRRDSRVSINFRVSVSGLQKHWSRQCLVTNEKPPLHMCQAMEVILGRADLP